ncbi:MAG: HlyD family efflux transporter periplasmic adaptor subunit [bacterium]
MKKFLVPVLMLLLAFVSISCGGKAKNPLETATVTRGAIKAQTPTTGMVEPRNRLEIKPPVSGRIESVLVAEGQIVKKGKILAMMSSSDRAALLDAARSKSAEEYKEWEQAYKPAPIVAPLDGFLIQKNIEPGQTVTAQDPVLVMADILIVKAQVDETDIGNIKLGQSVTIQLDAYPEQIIKGKVEHIAYESTVVSNVTIYRVDVVPEKVPGFFRSGMSATVSFIREQKSNVLLVPIKAVKKIGLVSYAFQYDKGAKTAKPIQIKTGLENASHIEVISGLKENDKVVIPDKKMITDLESRSQHRRGLMNPFQKRN